MSKEIEVKFRIGENDWKLLLNRLVPFGTHNIRIVDKYFNLGDMKGTLRMRSESLNGIPMRSCVTLKKKSETVSSGVSERTEIDPYILSDQKDQWVAIFEGLGFEQNVTVAKYRKTVETSLLGVGIEICFDEVGGLGYFVEIEFAKDTPLKDANEFINTIMYHWREYNISVESKGYYQLMKEALEWESN